MANLRGGARDEAFIRAYYAVLMQLGGIFSVFCGSIPFLLMMGKNSALGRFGGTLLVFVVLLAIATGVGGRICKLSVIDVIRLYRRHGAAGVNVEGYINGMAIVDVVILGWLVASSGGITKSSFVPLLLLVPVLAIIIEATRAKRIVQITNVVFLALVGVEFPEVRGVLAGGLGGYEWLADVNPDAAGAAYPASTVINLTISVWAIYFHYVFAEEARKSSV